MAAGFFDVSKFIASRQGQAVADQLQGSEFAQGSPDAAQPTPSPSPSPPTGDDGGGGEFIFDPKTGKLVSAAPSPDTAGAGATAEASSSSSSAAVANGNG